MGCVWGVLNEISSCAGLGSYRLPVLGYFRLDPSLVLPFDHRGKLARKPGRNSALSGWIPASLLRCAGVPKHFECDAHEWSRPSLCAEPRTLHSPILKTA